MFLLYSANHRYQNIIYQISHQHPNADALLLLQKLSDNIRRFSDILFG